MFHVCFYNSVNFLLKNYDVRHPFSFQLKKKVPFCGCPKCLSNQILIDHVLRTPSLFFFYFFFPQFYGQLIYCSLMHFKFNLHGVSKKDTSVVLGFTVHYDMVGEMPCFSIQQNLK